MISQGPTYPSEPPWLPLTLPDPPWPAMTTQNVALTLQTLVKFNCVIYSVFVFVPNIRQWSSIMSLGQIFRSVRHVRHFHMRYYAHLKAQWFLRNLTRTLKKRTVAKKQAYNAVIEFKIVLQKFPHSTCLSLYSISEYNLFENVLFNIFM